MIKTDVMKMLDDFHRTRKFVKSINSTFIALIPKVSWVTTIKDYRPISLVGTIYKLIVKVLTRRMATVLDSIIGSPQQAFLGGRQILDVALIANELVDEIINKKKNGVLCKLDMEKAYDNVNWAFLDYMLMRLGFRTRWRKWITTCIKSVSYAVIVDGGPSKFFRSTK